LNWKFSFPEAVGGKQILVMKIQIGCGLTLLDGFVNIDNSPTLLLARMPRFVPALLHKLSLLNDEQLNFSRTMNDRKKDIKYASCLHLPYKDGSIEFVYGSHVLGWYFDKEQTNKVMQEVYRVLKPGGGARLSFFDVDKVLADFQQHRDTVKLKELLPPGRHALGRHQKLRSLFHHVNYNGIAMNAETFTRYAAKNGFVDIRQMPIGTSAMKPEWIAGVDLSERGGETIYMECRKPNG
jgi:SAM-dependent methyltransferase